MTLVDTNVLLDLVTDDPVWADWSIEQLELASVSGPLFINDVVYAELSVRYERIEERDAFVDQAGLKFGPFPRAALFLAGKAFTRYRRGGGTRTGVLPDFFCRRPRGNTKLSLVDARCGSLPIVFSNGRSDLA